MTFCFYAELPLSILTSFYTANTAGRESFLTPVADAKNLLWYHGADTWHQIADFFVWRFYINKSRSDLLSLISQNIDDPHDIGVLCRLMAALMAHYTGGHNHHVA